MADRIYLDHASTTPILPEAAAAMLAALESWANPSSAHAEGRAVHAKLESARARMAAALGWDHSIFFTSGATEAIQIVLDRAAAGPRIVSAIEHPAVLRRAEQARRVNVGQDGLLDLEDLARSLEGVDRPLVAIQAVNNETGVIQPVEHAASLVQRAGGLLLVDCAQSAGKLPLPGADFITVAGHKFGGPAGVGALLVRDPATLAAVGGQESGYRPGTASVPLILGMAAAIEADHAWLHAMPGLRAQLDEGILEDGGEIIGESSPRLATIAAYRMPGVPAAAQIMQFDLAGIAVSAGSACSSGSLKTSAVLLAMGFAEAEAREVIRVSFGRGTQPEHVERFLAEWRRLAQRQRAA